MGKKAKVGKKRKDKFYHLAKETGYRARSAFKLIQLNRKYGFLQESRVLIDLCAAPGGWLQVAANFMPVSSVVIGVDLAAIKPIKNVITLQADITTDACRQSLRKELKTWKADCVLNDGAPNVGSAWVQDAFSQAHLTLAALRIGCDFLRRGGWFITKVFRSKDYHPLIWVLKQLFKKVHATKPQASRNESAEIFVVCQGYLAPDKLDPKFLDSKFVFKEVQEETRSNFDILRPEKERRSRGGYADGDYTLFKASNASEFVNSGSPLDLLASTNELILDKEEISTHPLTTEEIKLCCKDIKVLGKREIKSLLAWRRKLKKEFEKIQSTNEEQNGDDEATKEVDSEDEMQNLIDQAKEEESKELKKKKKQVVTKKRKLREKLAKQHTEGSGAFNTEEPDLFALKAIKSKQGLKKVNNADLDEEQALESSDSDDELQLGSSKESSDEESGDEEYDYYEKFGVYDGKKQSINTDLVQKQENFTKNLKKKRLEAPSENPLVMSLETDKSSQKTENWFQKDVFNSLDLEEDEDYDIELMTSRYREEGKKVKGLEESSDPPKQSIETTPETKGGDSLSQQVTVTSNNSEEKVIDHLADVDDNENESSSDDDSEIDDRSVAQSAQNKENIDKTTKENSFEIVPQNAPVPRRLTPEALALGTAIATSRKRKRDIIDESFNRYSFGEEDLPSWFASDEAKHTIRQMPVTKEEVRLYKERLKEINVRPVRKIVEAKARKKKKIEKKLERVRKKAETISDTIDFSEREKAAHIRSLYKKAGLLKKKTVDKAYVVAKKGLAGKRYRRPKGVSGPYKVVDPRLKKDVRAKLKAGKKGKGKGRKQGRGR